MNTQKVIKNDPGDKGEICPKSVAWTLKRVAEELLEVVKAMQKLPSKNTPTEPPP